MNDEDSKFDEQASSGNEDLPPSQIFVVDGKPVKFFLHESLTAGQRDALKRDIIKHGGRFSSTEERANTLITSRAVVELFKRKYMLDQRVYVEDASFVGVCINARRYRHTKPIFQPMGGRIGGKTRTPFTSDDDLRLARYIALRVPYKENGGRTGNAIYKQLEEQHLEFNREKWAARHPWSAWRERYNKNQDIFDPIIEQIVKDHPPAPDGKGQYTMVRKPEHGVLRKGVDIESDDEDLEEEPGEQKNQEEDEEEEDEWEMKLQSREAQKRAQTSSRSRKRARLTYGTALEYNLDEPNVISTIGDDEIYGNNMNGEERGRLKNARPGPNEAGPSGTQHTPTPSPTPRPPSPTLVANANRSDPDPTPRPSSRFPASQATLVAPELTPQLEPQNSPPPSARQGASTRPQPQRQPVQFATQSDPAANKLSERTDVIVVKSNRTGTRARAPSVRPQTTAAEPFRNTRSRSRSVEPQTQQPSARDESPQPSHLSTVGETYEDEISVEGVLGVISEGSTSAAAAVEDLLSDDDRETMQQLAHVNVEEHEPAPIQKKGATAPVTVRQGHSVVPPNGRNLTEKPERPDLEVTSDSDDDEIFKRLDEESRESLVRSILPSRPHPPLAQRPTMRSAAQAPTPVPFVDLDDLSKSRGISNTPAPVPPATRSRSQRTPAPSGSGATSAAIPRRRQPSTGSGATTESSDFPSPQTKAAQWQKDTPYKPDAGTRAARAAARRVKR